MAGVRSLALEAAGVAEEQGECIGFAGRLLESKHGAGGVIDGLIGVCEFGGHEVHLIVEQGDLHGAGAVEAPIGHGHFADDDVLDSVDRLEFFDQSEVKGEEGLAVLIAEDGGEGGAFRGGEAVGDAGVGGRAGFAFERNRPAGFQGVGAVGGKLAIG